MNLLFLTQSSSLELFYDLARNLSPDSGGGRAGFYISDSSFFRSFERENPEISSGKYQLLKEWEIVEKSGEIKPDFQRLRDYERRIGDPVLWNALVADRRIYLGKKATLEQDYKSRFNDEQMMAILQVALDEMTALFDRFKPDAVVGFICVTIGEYLAYLIAKDRKIPLINLRPTRIKNYFYAGESVQEPSENLTRAYYRILKDGIPETLKAETCTYLEEVRKTTAMYEGVVPGGKKLAAITAEASHGGNPISKLAASVKRCMAELYLYKLGRFRYDNSHRGVFYPLWFAKIKRPVRVSLTETCLRKHYVTREDLSRLDYVFFPLHKEPEVTLLVYSRPYLNQIEIIRGLARSLPVGMKLVIKDHPAGLGYHPVSYFRKILRIPNVVFAPYWMKSRDLVENAKLVAVISGSIALEALMMRRPVIHFGRVPFGCMPETMIRLIANLDDLAIQVKDLLQNHAHDENALIAYIVAVMQSSVPVDFYSVLLERRGVFKPAGVTESRDLQIRRLAQYIKNRVLSAEC